MLALKFCTSHRGLVTFKLQTSLSQQFALIEQIWVRAPTPGLGCLGLNYSFWHLTSWVTVGSYLISLFLSFFPHNKNYHLHKAAVIAYKTFTSQYTESTQQSVWLIGNAVKVLAVTVTTICYYECYHYYYLLLLLLLLVLGC